MILVYLLVIAALAVLQLLLHWRAVWLERAYMRVSAEADGLVKAGSTRGGNTNKPDPYQSAKQQYELALATLRRDGIERAYTWWQAAADRLGYWRKGLAGYKGKVLPYLLGSLDVAGVVLLAHWLGVNLASVRALLGPG